MGRKEEPMIAYYNDPGHFADLMNGWIYRGEKKLTARHLLENMEKIFFRMFWILCLKTENTENYGKVFRSPVMERFVCVMAVLVRNSIAR